MNKNKTLVLLVWFAGIFALWELGAFSLVNIFHDKMAASKLPFPHEVIGTLIKNWQSLSEAGAVTFSKAATGFALGASIGIILAILMSISKIAEQIAFPYLIVSQMIPVLGLAPIIFNLVRNMDASRIIIAAYITFFPVAANMLSGLKSVDVDKRELMYSYAAKKPGIYMKLMLPFSLPYLFSGLKIAAPLSVTASILVDMLGSKNGIGVKLLYSLYGGTKDIFWASVVTSALMGIISYFIVIIAERIFIPWKKEFNTKAGED